MAKKMVKRGKRGKNKPAKAVRKKKSSSRKGSNKEESFQVGFEEVIIRCSSCGREFRIVKSAGFDTEGMLCQRCSAGGGTGFEDDSDF